MKDRYLCTRDTNHKSIIMPQTTLNKIEFIAMVVALFAKKHRYSEPVAYQYISKYGGAKLLIDHYGFLHTQVKIWMSSVIVREVQYDETVSWQ